jgi:hypothetical protein
MATSVWNNINGRNLKENILPTRSRANLIPRKARITASSGLMKVVGRPSPPGGLARLYRDSRQVLGGSPSLRRQFEGIRDLDQHRLAHARPKNDTPTGSPIAKPAGTVMADTPPPRPASSRRRPRCLHDEIGDPGRRAGRREERIEPVGGHHGVDPLGARDPAALGERVR